MMSKFFIGTTFFFIFLKMFYNSDLNLILAGRIVDNDIFIVLACL